MSKKILIAVTTLVALALIAIYMFLNQVPKELNPKSVIKGVNYIGATVIDLERSENFYRAADLRAVDHTSIEGNAAFDVLAGRSGVVADTRMLRSVNSQIRLMKFNNSQSVNAHPPIPVQGPGIAHVCYQVAQSTNTYQRFFR